MDRDSLKLAFGYYVVQRVVGADGRIDPSEEAFVEHWFPKQTLLDRGLTGQAGELTSYGRAALGDALLTLPTLPLMERLAMLEVFQEAANADGILVSQEVAWIEHAAWLLGVRPDQMRALHKQSLPLTS